MKNTKENNTVDLDKIAKNLSRELKIVNDRIYKERRESLSKFENIKLKLKKALEKDIDELKKYGKVKHKITRKVTFDIDGKVDFFGRRGDKFLSGTVRTTGSPLKVNMDTYGGPSYIDQPLSELDIPEKINKQIKKKEELEKKFVNKVKAELKKNDVKLDDYNLQDVCYKLMY
jgi:hypothetical protein